MKLTKAHLKNLIKETLQESTFHFAAEDIAYGLAYDAATAVVNKKTNKGELAELSPEDLHMLSEDIRDAVKKINKNYLESSGGSYDTSMYGGSYDASIYDDDE